MPTVEGKQIEAHVKSATDITINDAKVLTADIGGIDASNGVVHNIDTVLMPPSDSALEAWQTGPTTCVADDKPCFVQPDGQSDCCPGSLCLRPLYGDQATCVHKGTPP